MFGHEEIVTELLPRASVIATRFSGESLQSDVVERVKFAGNLLTLHESLTRFITRYCDLRDQRVKNSSTTQEEQSPVPARANYHRGVVLDALANMLDH